MKENELTLLAKKIADHKNRSVVTIGHLATKDGKFFKRLENGGSCTLRRYNSLMNWFLNNWPADLEWPKEIPRPKFDKNTQKVA